MGFKTSGPRYGCEYVVLYGVAYGFILWVFWVLLSMGLFGGLRVEV